MTGHRTIRRRAAALLAAAGAVALASGCIKIETDLTLDGDTASGTLLTAVEASALQAAGIPPEEFLAEEDVFGPSPDGLASADGVTAEEYDDGEWVGVRYHLEDAELSLINDYSDETGGMRIDYDPDEGRYEFVADIDMSFEDLEEQEDLGGQGELPQIDPQMLLQDLEMYVAITFPGEVVEHNGELSGTTVEWSAAPGEHTEMRAVARDQPAGDPAAGGPAEGDPAAGDPGTDAAGSESGFGVAGWIALAALAVAVLGAGAIVTGMVVASRRRGGDGTPGDGSATGHGVAADG